MKILVTGSEGFVGRHLVRALGSRYQVIRLSRSLGFDLKSYDSLKDLDAVDAVVHLAALVSSVTANSPMDDLYQLNLAAAQNVARFCREKQVPQLINLNTYVYGVPQYLPIDEAHPVLPASHYSKSKHLAEQLLFYYLDTGTSVVSLRVFNIFGAGQSSDFLVPLILKQALGGDTIRLREARSQRDFLYVEDLVDLIVQILSSPIPAGVYNVGSGVLSGIQDVIDLTGSILGKNLNLQVQEESAHSVSACNANIGRITAASRWRPCTSLRDGLTRTLEAMKNE